MPGAVFWTIKGMADVELVVMFLFDKDLKVNGPVRASKVKATKRRRGITS